MPRAALPECCWTVRRNWSPNTSRTRRPRHGSKRCDRGAEYAARMGWTQLSIAGAKWDEIAMLHALLEEGDVPIRTYVAVPGPGPEADRLLHIGVQSEDPRLVVRGIKVVMDGALGSQGAALLAPYEDRPGAGIVMHQEDELAAMFDEALGVGTGGDARYRRLSQSADAGLLSSEPLSGCRDGIGWSRNPLACGACADSQCTEDLPRFAKLDVIPSMQASHALTDLHFALRRLGAGSSSRATLPGAAWLIRA